jgi:hypothetical protein
MRAPFLRGLFYDTALADDPIALAATRQFAGADHVVLGSDWPYVDAIDVVAAGFGPNGAALLRG